MFKIGDKVKLIPNKQNLEYWTNPNRGKNLVPSYTILTIKQIVDDCIYVNEVRFSLRQDRVEHSKDVLPEELFTL